MNTSSAILRSALVASLGLLITLSGCSNDEHANIRPLNAQSLSVAETSSTHRIYFEIDSASLTAEQLEGLKSFLAAQNENGFVQIDGRADSRASDVYNIELSARRVAAVANELRRFRPDLTASSTPLGERSLTSLQKTSSDDAAQRSVELTAISRHVVVPNCNNWSEPITPNHANDDLPYLGCANVRNLAAMISDPSDLKENNSILSADATRQAAAIERYRTDKVKELNKEELAK